VSALGVGASGREAARRTGELLGLLGLAEYADRPASDLSHGDERRLGVAPTDFRMWVALHEVTHRTQFTAVPWLHAHVRSEVRELLEHGWR